MPKYIPILVASPEMRALFTLSNSNHLSPSLGHGNQFTLSVACTKPSGKFVTLYYFFTVTTLSESPPFVWFEFPYPLEIERYLC